jgi:hypothetical protein
VDGVIRVLARNLRLIDWRLDPKDSFRFTVKRDRDPGAQCVVLRDYFLVGPAFDWIGEDTDEA